MRSPFVELYLCKFSDLVSQISLVIKIVYLLYACTSTSISSRIFVFEYFLLTFPNTLNFDVEKFAMCTQNYIYLVCFNV